MKYALSLFSTTAFAQTLAPATPGFDFAGYGIWLLVALAVVGLFVFFKRHPATVSSLTELLHKHEETHAALVDAHTELLAKQPTSPPATTVTPKGFL